MVDGSDTVLLEDAFYSKPASENWNPDADINNNLTVDIYDAIILSSNFAKTI